MAWLLMMMFAVTAAPVREIPNLGELFASEALIFNEVFAKAAIDIPTPAFATARAFLA